MPVDFEFIGNIVLIRAMGRPPLALTRSQFDEARKRGEQYAQATPFDTRTTPTPYAENHQAPQEIKHASLTVVGRESVAEPEATTREKEGEMAHLIVELPADQLSAQGRLRDIDELMLAADRLTVIALEAGGIDWENGDFMETAKKAHGHATQRIDALERNLEEKSTQVLQLLALLQRASGLQLQEIHDTLGQVRPNWQPSVNPRQVVEYAMQHGIQDLSTAAEHMRQQAASAEANKPRRDFRQRGRTSTQDIRNAVQQRIGRPDLPW